MSENNRARIECADLAPMLIYERQLRAPVETVWAALTESEQTARWYGSWTGTPGAGNIIEVTWTAEEGNPTQSMTILACEPPRLLVLSSGESDYPWIMTVELHESDSGTLLEFRQPMWGKVTPAMVGTGWEFYLDRLTGVLDGDDELPAWDDRYQALQPHYEELQAAMALCDRD